MGMITVGVRVDHIGSPSSCRSGAEQSKSRVLLAPNVPHSGTVKSTLKAFVRDYLLVPEDRQLLTAPAFTKLQDSRPVEEIYKRYACQADLDNCDLYVDEDVLTFFVRENAKIVHLADESNLAEYNILDKSVVQFQKVPQILPRTGGRMFVETKDGLLPLLGISGLTRVSALKEAIEKHTGIPACQQLLSSVGRVMHDEFCVKDFDGVHTIYEDSIVDLTRSGDKNADQWHLRMFININIIGEQEFELLVQGRDLIRSIMNVVEERSGIPSWQQRIRFSGKVLEEKKALGEYFINPQCTLQVALFRNSMKKSPFKPGASLYKSENAGGDSSYTPAARKIKMVRTCKGTAVGTVTIPILTSDTVADLRRKVKRSLKPLVEQNVPVVATPPPKDSKLKVAESMGAYRLPPPPLEHNSPPTSPSKYETPRAKLLTSPSSYETPRAKLVSPGTPSSSYKTPLLTRSKTQVPSRPSSITEDQPDSNSVRKPGKTSTRRYLKFGAAEKITSPQRIFSTLDENALSYCQPSVQEKINKALVHIVNAGGSSESSSKISATIEKKGLGAWLKQMKAGLH